MTDPNPELEVVTADDLASDDVAGHLKSKPDIDWNDPTTQGALAGGAAASWALSGVVGLAAYGAGLAFGYATAGAYYYATGSGTTTAPGTGPATPPGSPW